MAAKLLCGQVKATNFISRSSCSYDTMLKKVSFSAQIIHQQLAESLLFHFRFVQLTSKHFSWLAEQKHSATSQLNIPFLLLLVFSQLVYWLSQLHKVGCSKLQCFADRPPPAPLIHLGILDSICSLPVLSVGNKLILRSLSPNLEWKLMLIYKDFP